MADADDPEVIRPDEVVSCPLASGSAWDGTTRYRVTDLCLFSHGDLTALAAALAARGLVVTGGPRWLDIPEYSRLAGPHWNCQFQVTCEDQQDHPEPEIVAMLAAVEALDPPERAAWDGCVRRVFDPAFDCGVRPSAVHHYLSAGTLARLAAAGGELRLTLYALDPSEIQPAEPGAAADRAT